MPDDAPKFRMLHTMVRVRDLDKTEMAFIEHPDGYKIELIERH